MKLSTRTLYGTRLLVELARQYGKGVVQLSEIAKKLSLSEKYLGQIVILLKNYGLIISQRGSSGGYSLAKGPSGISLKEIYTTLEGPLNLIEKNSADRNESASEQFDKLIWGKMADSMNIIMESISLDTVLKDCLKKDDNLNYEI